MKGILADNDVQGQVEILLQIWQTPTWRDIWIDSGLELFTVDQLGMLPDCSDHVVWRTCQDHDVVLITGNRNDDGPESLEFTIRNLNTPSSLPVMTLSNPKRIKAERSYALDVAEKTLEYLSDMEGFRGTGRLYVP